MIRVKRTKAAPDSLTSAANVAKAAATAAHYATWKHPQRRYDAFAGYDDLDVKLQLKKDFNYKCAYCEKQIEKGYFEVEHYRPKGRVEGCSHSGYWWLALSWDNLLPSCPPCNRALRHEIVRKGMSRDEAEALQARPPRRSYGKAMQFPVSGTRLANPSHDHAAEGPLIIDPTRTDPEPYLEWHFDTDLSTVEGRTIGGAASPCGQTTVDCLALNRPDLVEGRTRVLDKLKHHRIKILEDLEKDADEDGGAHVSIALRTALRRVEDMKSGAEANQAFAGMTRSFVRSLASELVAWAIARGMALNGPA